MDRSEGFGERLLGLLQDRAHEMPPHLIAPMIAEEVARIGGRDVSVLLQDYAQEVLVPLPGRGVVVVATAEVMALRVASVDDDDPASETDAAFAAAMPRPTVQEVVRPTG